jgi:hypothetical protein
MWGMQARIAHPHLTTAAASAPQAAQSSSITCLDWAAIARGQALQPAQPKDHTLSQLYLWRGARRNQELKYTAHAQSLLALHVTLPTHLVKAQPS